MCNFETNSSVFLLCNCRGGTPKGTDRAAALSGGNFAECNDRDRLCNAIQTAVSVRGVQNGQSGPADYLAEFQLYGPTTGTGAESEGGRQAGGELVFVIIIVLIHFVIVK